MGILLKRGIPFGQGRRTRNLVKERVPFVRGRIESPNTSPQAIKLNPSSMEQAHFNSPGTGDGYESTNSLGKHLQALLEDHTRYDHNPGIHDKPRRVSLLVNKAQLAGCLKVWPKLSENMVKIGRKLDKA